MSSTIPDFDDDELTGKILAAMKDPVSDPETAIQELRAHQLSISTRTKRLEKLAADIAKDTRRVAGVVLAGSMSVVLSVVGAAYYVGAAQSQYRERLDEVIRRVDRMDGHAEANVERSEP